MPKMKESYPLTLETDQMNFVRWAKDKYGIEDESKVMRIIMDYIITNRDQYDSVFTYIRCLRCD
jgi:hypothetical protein